MQGLEELAADGRFVAGEGGEAVGFAGQALERGAAVAVGDLLLGGRLEGAVAPLLKVFGALAHAIGEQAGFHAEMALEAPLAGGDLEDEGLLDGVGRLERSVEGLEETLEVGRILAGDDEGLRGESVTERVFRGPGLARGGAGSGGFRCVAAIGRDLFLSCHWDAFPGP